MLESLVEWMSYPLYYAYDGAPPPARAGASHATIYPYGLFPAGDGKLTVTGQLAYFRHDEQFFRFRRTPARRSSPPRGSKSSRRRAAHCGISSTRTRKSEYTACWSDAFAASLAREPDPVVSLCRDRVTHAAFADARSTLLAADFGLTA